MSSPVSLHTPTTTVFIDEEFEFFDDEFENTRKILKEEAQAAREKTSSQAKILAKAGVDTCAQGTAPLITAPVKASVTAISPVSIASSINTIITHCVEPSIESSIQKIGYKSVDKCVDTTAKKVIDQSIDRSVDSTKSYMSAIYNFSQRKGSC